MISSITSLCLRTGVLAAAGLVPLVASAQPTPEREASGPVLEEVVVTAKLREESLQEVPLSITAFSADLLEEQQAFDLRDIAALTPGFSAASGSGRGDSTAIAMRGVVPNTSSERFQGVSVFVDGVALSGQLLGLDTTQVERIEVLKGPQNATFGRATYSGAINYVTRTPTGDEVTGGVRLRGGKTENARGENYYAGGYVTIPVLADRLWVGLSASANGNAGLYRDPSGRGDIGEERTRSGVASLYFTPNEKFSIKARFSFDEELDELGPRVTQHPREWLAEGVGLVRLTRAGNALWPTEVPDPRPGLAANLDDGIARPLEGGFERQRAFASIIARYDWNGHEVSYSYGRFRSLVWSINNFFNRANRPGQDPNFGALIGVPGGVTVNPLTTTATSSNPVKTMFENDSHQILVLSPGDRRLRWRAGLYYFKEDNLGYFPLLFGTAANPSGQSAGVQTFDNQAAFGGVDFDLTDRLTVSAEGRYQVEKNIWQTCAFCGTRTARDEEREEKDFLPRATVNFKLSKDHLLYALYSRGVKSGRLSNLAITVNGQPDFVYATPEQLDNYELGSKNTFWDGRAILNVAVYRANVKDQQIVSTQDVLTSAGARLITAAFNVGESRVNGAEIEATVKPFEAWTFGLGIGYADQEFTNGNPVVLQASSAALFPGVAGAPVFIKGKTQANVPAWNGSLTAAYKSTLGGTGLDLDVRLDALYRGSFYADLANIAEIPDSWKANLRVAIGRGDTWQASLYGRNIFDDRTATVTGLAGGAATCTFIETNVAQYGTSQQCLYAFMPRPREVGVELTYRF